MVGKSSSSTPLSSAPSKSKIVKLRLSPAALTQFVTEQPESKSTSVSRSKPSSSRSSSAPSEAPAEPSLQHTASKPGADAVSNGAAADATVPAAHSAEEANPSKRKGVPGPKPGLKRNLSATDVAAKQKSKPGPKKRKIQNEGEPFESTTGIKISITGPAPNLKLGPKANQGAINAGLRALDRSGKPCRKWEKKGFQVKSFTGVFWTVPTWKTPRGNAESFPGTVTSETSNSSDAKANEIDNSAVVSEKSNSGADTGTPSQVPVVASSPVAEVSVTG